MVLCVTHGIPTIGLTAGRQREIVRSLPGSGARGQVLCRLCYTQGGQGEKEPDPPSYVIRKDFKFDALKAVRATSFIGNLVSLTGFLFLLAYRTCPRCGGYPVPSMWQEDEAHSCSFTL